MNLRDHAERIDTSMLASGDTPTRALVVFNMMSEARSGRVRFAAAFPMRRELCPLPVMVRTPEGEVVPSRLTRSDITEPEERSPGRVLWTMELEFVADDVPAEGWRTFAAVFGFSVESRSEETTLFEALPLLDLPVIETECHPGTLPLSGCFRDTDAV